MTHGLCTGDLLQWDEWPCFANMGYKLVVFGISGSHRDVRCDRRAFKL